LRSRDKILAELNELSRNKRMGSAEEQAKCDCDGMESRLSLVQDEIVSNKKIIQVAKSIFGAVVIELYCCYWFFFLLENRRAKTQGRRQLFTTHSRKRGHPSTATRSRPAFTQGIGQRY
jgi:hypothetical protein